MSDLDLVNRNGNVVTAGRPVTGDVRSSGSSSGWQSCTCGAREIDATGSWSCQAGSTAIANPAALLHGDLTANDFMRHRLAACGGTTSVSRSPSQHKGRRCAKWSTTIAARRKAVVDHAFHLIVSDPAALMSELPASSATAQAFGHLADQTHARASTTRRGWKSWRWPGERARWSRSTPRTTRSSAGPSAACWRRPQSAQVPRDDPSAERRGRGREPPDRDGRVVDPPISSSTSRPKPRSQRSAGLRPTACGSSPRPARSTCSSGPGPDRPGPRGRQVDAEPAAARSDQQEAVSAGADRRVPDGDLRPRALSLRRDRQARRAQSPFEKVANGVPGMELRLLLLYCAGVRQGRIELNRFVELGSPTRRRSTACIRARARSRWVGCRHRGVGPRADGHGDGRDAARQRRLHRPTPGSR